VEILAVIGIVLLLLYLVTPLIVFSLLSRVSRLESDLRELRRQTDDLHTETFRPEHKLEAQTAAMAKAEAQAEPAPQTPAQRDVGEIIEKIYGKRAAAPVEEVEVHAPPPLPSQSGPTEAATSIVREQSAAAIEWLAERWMAWIGAAALLLGLGFFLKYAMDRGWIGPEVRVAMGLAFGAALYGLGVYLLRKDYRPVGQGVVGSSLGFWYLSLYAGHHWYSLISEDLMFGAMAVGAGAVLGLAIAFDAQAVAILGVLGGFLAPLLMKTGTPSPWPIFRFLLLVDAAALAGASFRRWRIAELVAFGATVLMWVVWINRVYTEPYLADVLWLLSLFFVLFVGVVVWNFFIQERPLVPDDLILVFATPAAYGFAVHELTKPLYSEWHGAMAIGLAALYAVLSLFGFRRAVDQRFLSACFLGISLSFVAAAIPLQFTGHWIPIVGAAYAAVLATIGLRWEVAPLRAGGFVVLGVIQVLLATYILDTIADPKHITPWWLQRAGWIDAPIFSGAWSFINGRSLAMLTNALALGWIAREYRRHAKPIFAWEASAFEWTLLGSLLGTAGTAVLETFAYVYSRGWPTDTFASLAAVEIAVLVAVMSFMAVRSGPRWLFDVARGFAIFLFAGLAIGCLIVAADRGHVDSLTRHPLWSNAILFNPRGAAFLASISAMFFVFNIARRRPELAGDFEQKTGWTPASQFAFLALLAGWLMIATETFAYSQVHKWNDTLTLSASTVHVAALAAAAIALTIRLGPPSSSAVAVAASVIVAMMCLGLAALTFDAAKWMREATGFGWLLPAVVNPRGLSFAAATTSLIWFARLTRHRPTLGVGGPFGSSSLYSFSATLAHLALWLAITVEVYALGLSQDWGTGKSLGVTLAWVGYGLGLFAVGLAWRWTSVRLASLVVFIATTAKVFLSDLWELAPVIRYVAFIGLGVALLSTSYFYRRFKDRLREFIANPDAKL
jgi:uncharacterized membrane protein